MARIQIDFDQVMLFGDLHRDISTSLQAHSAAFLNTPGARLDQIIDAFDLSRVTSNEHFQGQSIAWSLQDGKERADRVAHSLMQTSTRIFRQAEPIDDHFEWWPALFRSIGSGLLAGPGVALLEVVGGELVGFVAQNAAIGALVTPGLFALYPAYYLATGLLSVVEGGLQVLHAAGDAWEYAAGGLRVVAGLSSIAIGVVGTIGFAVATAGAVLASPVVIVAAVVGGVATVALLAVENRAAIANVLGFGNTETERRGDLLTPSPGGTIALSGGPGATVVREFQTSSQGDLLPGGLLQGSSVVLQAAAPGQRQIDSLGPNEMNSNPLTGIEGSPAVASAPEFGRPGDAVGVLSLGGGKAAYDTMLPTPDSRPNYVGGHYEGFRDDFGMQYQNCTSWVAFRRNELMLDAPNGGDGWEWGKDPNLAPTLGAIVSYGSGISGDWGHVMLIEEMMGPDKFRVSEMNWNLEGGFRDSIVWERAGPGGQWTASDKPMVPRTLRFTP